MLNVYPSHFIDLHFDKVIKNFYNPDTSYNNNTSSNDFKNSIVLPLISKISYKIKHTLRTKCNIPTIFWAPFKLNRIIKLGKDRLEKHNNKNLIYQVNCKNCPANYVGQTKRLLKTRIGEHENNINLSSKYHNVISKHILTNNRTHDFDYNYNNVKILHNETNFKKRSFAEMVYIRK